MKTTAAKVTVDASLYAEVKAKAKAEKVTVKSIVENAFLAFVQGAPVEAPAPAALPADAVLEMLDEQQAEANRESAAAEQAGDPERATRARRTIAMIGKLRQAHAAAAARVA